LDNDGQLEIVIVNMDEPPSLLKNLAPRIGNSFIGQIADAFWQRRNRSTSHLDFRGEEADRRSTQRRFVHFSQRFSPSLRTRKGKTAADLSVRWTDGKTENYPAVAAGQIVTIQEREGHCWQAAVYFGQP